MHMTHSALGESDRRCCSRTLPMELGSGPTSWSRRSAGGVPSTRKVRMVGLFPPLESPISMAMKGEVRLFRGEETRDEMTDAEDEERLLKPDTPRSARGRMRLLPPPPLLLALLPPLLDDILASSNGLGRRRSVV